LVLVGTLLYPAAQAADLYVLEPGLQQVQVVQTGSNGFPASVTATIPVGTLAQKAVATPNQKSVWVTNGGDGTVTIISTANNSTQIISTASPGEVACVPNNFPTPCTIPGALVFNASGTEAFVNDLGDNTVKIINTGSGAVVKAIPVGNLPTRIAITPDSSKLYIPNLLDNTVSVISTSSQTVLTTIAMPGSTFHGTTPPGCTLSDPSPTGIAVRPDGEFAYVTNAYDDNLVPACQPFEPSTVSVIRVATNTVINPTRPIPTGGFVATEVNFLPRWWCTHCGVALVANTGTDAFPDNRIGAIATASQSLINVTTEPAPIIGPSEVDPVFHLTYVPNIGNGAGESIVTLSNYSFAVVNTFALPSGSFSVQHRSHPLKRRVARQLIQSLLIVVTCASTTACLRSQGLPRT